MITLLYWVLILAVTVVGAQQLSECPPTWFDNGGHCYNFVFSPELTYQEAAIFCQRDMSYLVSINSAAEHGFIQNWLNTHDGNRLDWFTSGYRDATGSIFWESDGSIVGLDYFPDTDIRNKKENDAVTQIEYNMIVYKYYGTSLGYMWAWSRLMKTGPFICEMDKSDVWRLYQQQRDFSFGTNITDPNQWEVGPNITSQSQDTVFYESNHQRTTVTLDCQASGNPRPTYTWYRQPSGQPGNVMVTSETNSRYSVTNGRLIITNPDPDIDVSKYTCVATNKLGTSMSNPIEVSYGYLGEFPNVQTSAVDATIFMGKMLTCKPPAAKPALRYGWYKSNFNFIRPELNAQYFLSKNGGLYISEVQAADQDVYHCMVYLAPMSGQVLTGAQPPSRTSMGIQLNVHSGSANTYGPDIQDKFPQHFPDVPMVGDMVEIECVAYGRLPLYYSWVREDGPLHPRAYTKDHNRVLVIPSARLEDTGIYTCVVRGDTNTANKTLIVSLKAKPSFPYPLQNQHVDEGGCLTWTCSAIGVPKPTYAWYKNGVLITPSPESGVKVNRNILTIDKVEASKHNGMYQCEASNSYGLARSSAQLRTLSFAPTFQKSPVETSKLGAEGGNVTISCNPQAAPRAQIKWMKNGAEVGRVLPNGDLELSTLSQADSGIYTCMATNDLGEARSSCTLTILGRMVISEVPNNLQISQNETAVLPCKASFDHGQTEVMYSWKFYSHALDLTGRSEDRVHYSMPNSPDSGKLYIIAAQFEHEGEYTCVVSTVSGSITSSAFVTVRGPPGEPAGVHAREGKNGSRSVIGNVELWWQEGEYHGFPVTKYTAEYISIFEQDWKVLKQDIPAHETVISEFQDWRGIDVKTGLSPGTLYQFRVKAGNDQVGYGPPSAGPHKWFSMQSAPPIYPPPNVGGGGGSVGLLVITWDPLPRSWWGGDSLTYIVYFRRQDNKDIDGKWERSATISGTHLHVLVGQEFYYSPYEVKVQAVNEIGPGPNSTIAIVYSAEDMPSNVAPTFVDALVLNGTAAVVNWIPVRNTRESAKGTVFAYQINYWQEPTTLCLGVNEHLALFNRFYGDVSSGLLIGMVPEGHYCFNLQFINHAGLGPKTDIYNFNLNLAPPGDYPEYVTVMSHGNESVRLYWKGVVTNVGEETIRGYKAWWWDIREDIRAARNVTFGKTFTGVLHGVEKDVIYKVRVFAYSIGGDGKKSQDVFFTLGGQVQYDPVTTELLNSAPAVRWPSRDLHFLTFFITVTFLNL